MLPKPQPPSKTSLSLKRLVGSPYVLPTGKGDKNPLRPDTVPVPPVRSAK